MLHEFDVNFKRHNGILNRCIIPKAYAGHQHQAYIAITNLLRSREALILRVQTSQSASPYSNPTQSSAAECLTDLGLGGILFEGASGIGKTYFVNQIIREYKERTKHQVYRISATTPYLEKVRLLKKAFAEGALVIAEEMNTSLWPNELLNNFLMGVDEQGNAAKNPGFMLIATQNPPSMYGREEVDPAIRRRLVKMNLDWPPYKTDNYAPLQDKKNEIAIKNHIQSIHTDIQNDVFQFTLNDQAAESALLANPTLPFICTTDTNSGEYAIYSYNLSGDIVRNMFDLSKNPVSTQNIIDYAQNHAEHIQTMQRKTQMSADLQEHNHAKKYPQQGQEIYDLTETKPELSQLEQLDPHKNAKNQKSMREHFKIRADNIPMGVSQKLESNALSPSLETYDSADTEPELSQLVHDDNAENQKEFKKNINMVGGNISMDVQQKLEGNAWSPSPETYDSAETEPSL